MQLKTWFLVFYLLSACNAFAAAQVEERELRGNAFATAQQKADFARLKADDAEQQVRAAERALAEAERADREAQKRAAETGRRLEEAKAGLGRAHADLAAAKALSRQAVEKLDQASGQRDRPQ